MKWPPADRPLEGSIVRLEPIGPEHRDELRAISLAEEIWTWLRRDVPVSDEAFAEWFDARLQGSEALDEWGFAIRSVESGGLIGTTSFMYIRLQHDGLEFGWTWLHPSAWRTGANVETKLLLLTEAFDELGCMRVAFKTDTRNARSRAALEALPATFEGILREHMLMPGIGRRDSVYYSIVDTEWPQVRANLERRLARGAVRA